jgi:hypothetical protein
MTAKMAVLTLAVIVALGGLGAGLIRTIDEGDAQAVEPLELRKDDSGTELVAETDDDEGDGDSTRGDDGTRGGDNTGDRDSTRGDDGTRGGDNTGDGDATWGNDGTGGGDNSFVTPADPGYYGGGDSGGGYSTG